MTAIRGAICAGSNSKAAISRATKQLLGEILRRNGLQTVRIAAAWFTMTPDLDAEFPAHVAREMGWEDVPMLGAEECQVAGATERVIRVLLLVDGHNAPRHVYLGEAAAMRPDLAEPGDAEWQPDMAGRADVRVGAGEQGRLLVIGLGMIGGSVAAAARASTCFTAVRGYDSDPEVVRLALRLDLVEGAGRDLGGELEAADVVVLATPVLQILELLPLVGERVAPGALVTDVGSTKRSVVIAMGSLPRGVGAVGGHPMAGGTGAGPRAASAGLFRGANWALVPAPQTDEATLARAESFVRGVGAEPVRVEAETHDRVVAVTSHLPALLAVGLVEEAAKLRRSVAPDAFLAGPGFGSASRLAGANAVMVSQMLADNSDNVGRAVDGLVEALGELRQSLAADPGYLERRLAEACEEHGVLVPKPA